MALPKVLRTKITPPVLSTRTLLRPRLQAVLEQVLNHRLSILQAGAGCGKTTALASLVELRHPLVWYQLSEEDSDPLVFLMHLCSAIQLALPELPGLPLPFLESWDGSLGPLPAASVLDQILNAFSEHASQPVLLALDDVNLVITSPEIAHLLDRLVGMAPPTIHIVVATRPPLKLPNLSRWKAQGAVLSIDQATLAFTPDEIADLFMRHYGYELTFDEAQALHKTTEGWAIAVQLVWQSLRSTNPGPTAATLETILARPAASLESLFDLLAREAFGSQPADVQEFLLASATLREMTPDACDSLRANKDSAAMLAYLRRQELFVVNLEPPVSPERTGLALPPSSPHARLRYHYIFHDFLRQQSTQEDRLRWHRLAANYFRSLQDYEPAIYHHLQAQDPDGAADLLDAYGPQLLSAGRLDTLTTYLQALAVASPPTLRLHPMLLSLLGDLARLHSRFQEALGWYQQAETICRQRGLAEGALRALRGQARVYLDTVNPSKAEEILQQTIRLSDGIDDREDQVRLYELLAENRLNAGKVDEAERLRHQAEALRTEGPSDAQLLLRVLLRTGRLDEARSQLEARAEAERSQPVLTPRAHRETLLLLSLVYSLQGLGEQALDAALDGTRRGTDLHSPFINAVGHIRQGHALMLFSPDQDYSTARQQFEKTIEISRQLAVPRLLAETYWGLCRSHGYQSDIPQALIYAQKAVEISSQAGDEWVASLARLAMGSSLAQVDRILPGYGPQQAEEWLNLALRGFQECSDSFGQAITRLWLSLTWRRRKDLDDHQRFGLLQSTLPRALAACRQNGYGFLFTRPTLLGPADERLFTPLLILARTHAWEASYAQRLLAELGLEHITSHPGYRLRILTLGGFQVWRGQQPIPSNGWRREKARHLFQLLVTFRRTPLDRDQIIEYLWPAQDPAAAQRSFKVALNTLFQVLDPERDPGSESAYIFRDGSLYGLRQEADIWIDSQEFLDLSASVPVSGLSAAQTEEPTLIQSLQKSLLLYQGEYLPDARYETWAAAEREQLSVVFLRQADQLAALLLDEQRPQECIDICHRILAQDSCWERAYRMLMLAYHQLGDRGQLARAYQRCVQTLHTELEVAPTVETQSLYQHLSQA